MAGGDAYLADAPPLPGQLGTQQLNGKAVDGRSREGAVATIMEGSQDSGHSGTTTTSSEVMMNERYNELERLGLVGEHTTSLWIGNIPESSSSEEAIRLLFGEFGAIRRVYVRRKPSPAMSWCLLLFRSSEGALAALKAPPPTVVRRGEHGKDETVQLLVELPELESQLAKVNAGALGSVVEMALDDCAEDTPPAERQAAAADSGADPSPGSGRGRGRVSPRRAPASPPAQPKSNGWVPQGVRVAGTSPAPAKTASREDNSPSPSPSPTPSQQSGSPSPSQRQSVESPRATSPGPPAPSRRTSSPGGEGPQRHALVASPPPAPQPAPAQLKSKWSESTPILGRSPRSYPGPEETRRFSRSDSVPNMQRRKSAAELEIRGRKRADEITEDSSVLGKEQASKRSQWTRMRSSGFRNKLLVAAHFAMNDDANELEAKRAINAKMVVIKAEELNITPTLKALAELHRGELRGLDYRFKTAASLFRKIMARLDASLADVATQKGAKEAPPNPTDILETILDVLRYTAVFQTREYTASVRKIMSALKENGFKELRVKNYWGPGDGYQGINTVFVSPTGLPFELQFHTPESLSMKEEACHSSYEKFRSASDSSKMIQYWEEMVSMWDMVPVPEDVLQIPKVVQQELEFDLSKLTEEERAAIGHRKDLEAVSRYPVEELHARAVKAEAEIGSLMVYLMNKHGPGGVCEQKEKRGAVRAQLSMLRQLVDTLLQDEAKEEGARLEELVKYLRTVPTFNELSESVITSIAHSVEPQSFAEGDVILKKGQKGGAFYMIHSGEVGFSLNDDGKMNKSRGKSEFFGEIGLMSDDHLVTATAIAKTACECYVLSKARFDELVRESMKALTGARDMPVRTRSKTEVAEASYAKMGVKTKQKTSLVSESFKTVHRTSNEAQYAKAYTKLSRSISKMSMSNDSENAMAKSTDDNRSDDLPDEPTLRDKLRELELDYPPLKYKIVCQREELYTMCVHGFLRDIAQDDDYDIYAVNNWWDDLEKFGAVNARFLAVRHGIRFEVTLHTEQSWDALTTHNAYMARKFDTVIKTDVLFAADAGKVQQTKEQMRREEMWRDRWARISVPDRALTIGTLRYNHVPCPPRDDVLDDARKAVGQSRVAMRQLQKAARKVHLGVKTMGAMESWAGGPARHSEAVDTVASGASSLAHSRHMSPHSSFDSANSFRQHADEAGAAAESVGGAWAELVGAWIASDKSLGEGFAAFRERYLGEKGAEPSLWEPLPARVAGLEAGLERLQKRRGEEEEERPVGCFCGGRRRRVAPERSAPRVNSTAGQPKPRKVLEP